jgi:hypothetical protein
MDLFIYSLTFLFTYILSSQVIFLLLTRAFPKPDRSGFFLLFFLALGLGPVLIAFFTKILVELFPYHSKYLYIISIIAFFGLIFFFNFKQNRAVSFDLQRSISKNNVPWFF